MSEVVTDETGKALMTREMNLTIGEFAEELGEDYLTASSVVKVLVKAGIAKENGTRAKAPGTRGKAATVYTIPERFELVLFPEVPETPTGVESAVVENTGAPLETAKPTMEISVPSVPVEPVTIAPVAIEPTIPVETPAPAPVETPENAVGLAG